MGTRPERFWGEGEGKKLYYAVLFWGALASHTHCPVTLYNKLTLASPGAQQSPKYLILSMNKDQLKTRMKCDGIYKFERNMMGDWRKKGPKKRKIIARLVSLPLHLYDMESRLFSDIQNRPKTSRTILMGEGPKLIRIKEQTGRGAARKSDNMKNSNMGSRSSRLGLAGC